jgi:amino acid transporter
MADNERETSPLLPSTSPSGTAISSEHPDRSVAHDTIPETAIYGRSLTWSSAYILVISRVIGSGIFATPGAIVKSVGSIGLALTLWIVGTILSACGLAVSMEYGCMLPRSGGEKVYLEFTYRYPRFLASTLVAVQAVLLGFTASNCIIFSKYTWFAFNIHPTEFQSKSLALGLLAVITIIHGCFMKTGIVIQNALGWVKIFLIIFMALSGVYVILFLQKPEITPNLTLPVDSNMLWEELWKDSDWSWNTISTSLFKVFYSYAGLGNMNNVLNEVKNPVRTLKTVGPAALITACTLYLLANVSYFLVVPLDEIKGSGELVAALFFERAFGPSLGRTILPLMIAVSGAGNVMVVTFALVSIRVYYTNANVVH